MKGGRLVDRSSRSPASRPPESPHLKDQAKDLLKAGAAASITGAQFEIAQTQFDDAGSPVTQQLIERGVISPFARSFRATTNGPGEIVECTPLGFALLFGGAPQRRTVTLLRECGAVAR